MMQGNVGLREIGFKGLQTYKEELPKEGEKCSCQSNCRNDYTKLLGKDPATKSDQFLEKFQGGEGIFNPKIYVADFGNFKQGFLSMKLIQK